MRTKPSVEQRAKFLHHHFNMDKEQTQRILKSACLDFESAAEYEENSRQGCLFAWHIDALEIYETPKELSDFGLTRAPQSWCYLEDIG